MEAINAAASSGSVALSASTSADTATLGFAAPAPLSDCPCPVNASNTGLPELLPPSHACTAALSWFGLCSMVTGGYFPRTTNTEYPLAAASVNVSPSCETLSTRGCGCIELRSNHESPMRRSVNQCWLRLRINPSSASGFAETPRTDSAPMGVEVRPSEPSADVITCTLKKPSARTFPDSDSSPVPRSALRSWASRPCATSARATSSSSFAWSRLFSACTAHKLPICFSW
mmetsp:Transcript_30709/g.76841  ORF Transcript_30709/g.76841 Transcript_30709/m.76841 type:complete len:230 (+) Transcript_30709:183-872(+)